MAAFSKEQAQKALDNNLYTVIAVDDNQTIGMGFKIIPYEFCGSGMRKVIRK